MPDEPSTDDRPATELLVADLQALPPTIDVETAGRAFGIGRATAYRLARGDQFPCKVVRAGRSYRVVTSDLRRVLGVPQPAEQTPAEQAPAA
ncbi:DNA-binding protein [[Kitasatospora] papulosa]|uniref:DNA-binding protein n=1 Tax=[Kitasatospora] papulosa TaxID=1464011 RepID=UPI0036CB5676